MGNVNIREFPDDLHRALKIKAAEDMTSLKELLIRYAREGLERDKKKLKGRK